MSTRYAKKTALLMTLLMVLSAFAMFVPAPVGAETSTDSRADTEPTNDEINGADTLTSGVPNPGSLVVSPADDYADWYAITCNRGQVINVSLYHLDWNAADPGQYNLHIVLFGPEEEGSNNYVPSWFSFLQTRYETASGLCAFTAWYFVAVVVNSTNDNPPQLATDPTNYIIDATVADPPALAGGATDQKTLDIESSQWFQWYKINTNEDEIFNVHLQNPNGGNIDMDMFGLWDRGYQTTTYQGYQPFFMNQTRIDSTSGNAEVMLGQAGEMDVYVRLWLRSGTGLEQYTLNIQTTMIQSDNNNIPEDAYLIEKTTSFLAYGHQSTDHFDWYKFNIDAGFTLDLTFSLQNVKSSYWNLTIWDDSLNYEEGWFNTQDGGPYRAPDQGSGDPGNLISSAGITKMDWKPITPGTYYIMIMAIAGDPVNHMREPPLAGQYYRLYLGLPNFGPENKTQIPDAVIDEDGGFSGLDLVDYFQDPEGDLLTFSVSDDNPSVLTKLVGDSNVTATPAGDWSGTCNITVEATDGGANIGANTIYQTFKLTVDPVNDDPYIKTWFTNFTMFEGERDRQTAPYKLSDVFDDKDSELTYTYSGNIKIQVRVDADTKVFFTAPDLWFGEENITFTAKDEETNPVKVTVTVRVSHRNHAPTISFGRDRYDIEMDEDDEADQSLNVKDMFEDIDTDYAYDYLIYKLKDPLPLHLNLSILDDGTLYIETEKDWSGDAEFSVACEDVFGVQNETRIYVIVEPVNDPPIINVYQPKDADLTVQEGGTETFVISSVVDIDNDTKYDIRYKWFVNNVLQWDENVQNHQFTFRTVNVEDDGFDEGVYHIKCIVTDGLASDEVEWTITVIDVNLPPKGARIVTPTTDVKYKFGKELLFEADDNASDPDGDPLYYKWVVRDKNITLSEERAFSLNWKDKDIKKALKPGKHTIDLYISDGRDGEVKTSMTITIKAKDTSGSPGFEALILLGALVVTVMAVGKRRRRS